MPNLYRRCIRTRRLDHAKSALISSRF